MPFPLLYCSLAKEEGVGQLQSRDKSKLVVCRVSLQTGKDEASMVI
jgi:hypothetical protein